MADPAAEPLFVQDLVLSFRAATGDPFPDAVPGFEQDRAAGGS